MKIINVVGYEGIYAVTDEGTIYSLRKGDVVIPFVRHDGYLQVVLNKDGHKQTTYVHKVVFYSFNAYKHLTRTDNLVIDHIDGNKQNNSLSNLRKLTTRENTSRAKTNKFGRGVHFIRKNNNYSADIQINNVKYHLGVFDTPKEASEAYLLAMSDYQTNGTLPLKIDRTIKYCTRCKQTKPISDFYHIKSHGYSYLCKECMRADAKARRLTNK